MTGERKIPDGAALWSRPRSIGRLCPPEAPKVDPELLKMVDEPPKPRCLCWPLQDPPEENEPPDKASQKIVERLQAGKKRKKKKENAGAG